MRITIDLEGQDSRAVHVGAASEAALGADLDGGAPSAYLLESLGARETGASLAKTGDLSAGGPPDWLLEGLSRQPAGAARMEAVSLERMGTIGNA